MNLSKLNRITHRDIGYLIAGLTIIYAVSGIALNHKHDWNPNYIIEDRGFTTRGENHTGDHLKGNSPGNTRKYTRRS